MIPITCSCGKKLIVKDPLAGKKIKCPSCAAIVVVPGARVPVSEAANTLPPSARSAPNVPIQAPPDPSRDPTNPSLSQPDATQTPEPKDEHDSSLTDFLVPPQADDELGRLGSFRILKILGHGGMGVVFMGEDPKLGRKVAIKAMLPHLAQSRSSQQRFLREAKTAAAIEHDHIVPILHVDEDRGSPFIVMPFLQGEPLDKRLARAKLPLAEVLRIAKEIARGLAAAHKRGLIHRDIKPANVWLETTENVDGESWTVDGEKPSAPSTVHRSPSTSFRVKILDFGLARAAAQDSGLTQQGAIIGTPAYMAPEQGRGEAVDARCDLWSLGVVLYKMLTGVQPFSGKDTVATLMAVAMHEPKTPCEVNPEVPRELSELTMRLLEKDADKRVAKAEDAAAALAQLEKVYAQAEDHTALMTAARKAAPTVIAGPMAARTQLPRETAATPRRSRAILLGALALVLALTAAAVYIFTRPPQEVGPVVNDGKKPIEAPIEPPPRNKVALEVDGKSRVEIASLKFPDEGPITLEAWVYRPKDSIQPVSAFLGIRKQLNFAFRTFGLVDCRFGIDTTTVNSKGPVPREKWAHIAAVWSNNVLTMFVDGQRTGANKAERPLPDAEGFFQLTGSPKAAVQFAGARLSNTPRYDANFTPSKSFVKDAHTLALYHCDEGAGNVLKDSSGNNHHGTIIGGTWVKLDDPAIERGIPNGGQPKLLYHKRPFKNDSLQAGTDLSFSADGDTLLAAGFDRAKAGVGMRFFEPWSGTELDAIHQKGPLTYRAALSPEGNVLAATSRNELQLWQWPSKNSVERIATKHIEPVAMAFSPDGRWLVWGDTEPSEDAVVYWRDRKNPEEKPLAVIAGKYRVNQAVFSADSRYLAVAVQNNRLAVFDASKCRLVFTRDLVGAPFSVSISSDAKRVAGFRKGKNGFEVTLFRIPSGDEEATFPMPALGHVGPFFDGNTKMVATDNDGRIAILDVIGKKTLYSFQGHDAPIRAEAVSPDGTLLATLDHDGTLKVWQLKSRERADDFALEFDGAQEVGVAFDGKLPAGIMAWTLEAFVVLPEKATKGQTLLAMGTRGFGASQFPKLSLSPGGVVAGPAGTFLPPYGQRIHCAAVFDGNEIRLYVDGGLKFRKDAKLLPPKDFLTSAERFKGSLDEIRFSRVARYDKDFIPKAYFQADANTLALYHCDEGEGDVLTDASGNARHAKITGGKWVRMVQNAQGPSLAIREVMARFAKSGLLGKASSNKATPEEFDDAIRFAEALQQARPPKGDLKSWSDLTATLVTELRAVAARDVSRLPALKEASNCANCHKLHK